MAVPAWRAVSLRVLVLGALGALGLLLSAGAARAAGCETDMDCKGERVCVAGVCTDPGPSVRPRHPGIHRPRLDQPRRLVNGYLGFHLGGGIQFEPDGLFLSSLASFRIEGYSALVRPVHVGAFVSTHVLLGDVDQWGQQIAVMQVVVGVSPRFGYQVNPNVWLGFSGDLGLLVLAEVLGLDAGERFDTVGGLPTLYLYPHLVGLFFFGAGAVRVGLQVALGIEATPLWRLDMLAVDGGRTRGSESEQSFAGIKASLGLVIGFD